MWSSLRVDVTPLREDRDFRVLFLAGAISMFGSFTTYVALPLQISGSPPWASTQRMVAALAKPTTVHAMVPALHAPTEAPHDAPPPGLPLSATPSQSSS